MKTKRLLLGALALMLMLTGCSKKAPTDSSELNGTYTGVANGMKGEISVEVTFEEGKITDVVVLSHDETYGVGYGMDTTPIEVLPTLIVENQSVNVDVITGATITSNAVRNGVKNAIEQAGGSPDELFVEEVSRVYESLSIETDVVIIGAGGAGMAAAIEAANAGAKVVILEKQGIVGGATTLSGGKLLAAGTSYQEEIGVTDDTSDDLFDYIKGVGGEYIDDAKLREFTDNALEDVAWLEDMGVDIINVEPIHSSITPWRVMNTAGGGGQISGIGGQISVPLYDLMSTTDTTVYYNVRATEVLVEDGVVAGVKGTYPDGAEVVVKANAVIIATGGYAQNREMTAFMGVEKYGTSVPAGNVGDGVKMAEAIGAQYFEAPGIQEVYVSYTCGVGINEESGLIVNDQGNRVVNEWTYQSHVATALSKTGSQVGWYIASADDPNPTVQYGMSLDSTLKAETAEELAELMGVDAEALASTIARYNELADKGVDEDFGKPAEYLIPVTGTLYAIKMNPAYTVTFGGLVTTLKSEVLDVDNNVIPGLYAAGEVAFTGLFGDEYPSCGLAIGSAIRFGRIAGIEAANYK